MCLYLTHKSEIKTAERDIEVWKIISFSDKSLFQGFHYEPNKLYRLRKKLSIVPVWHVSTKRYRHAVQQAFHSFVSLKQAIAEIQYYDGDRWKIVKFVIPKGAKYIKGAAGEIASTSLRSGDLVNVYGHDND